MKFFTVFFCLFSLLIYQSSFGEIKSFILNDKCDGSFKVMSYNVHHCNPPSAGDKIEVESIAKVILEEQPHLVALQEIDVNTVRSGKGKNQAQQLGELTGMYYYFTKAIDFQNGEYGIAVLSKFPIVDSLSIVLPIHSELKEELRAVAVTTVLLPTNEKILFASTHLGLKEGNRMLQAEKIIDKLGSNSMPFILAGDFNAEPDSKVIKYLDNYFTRSCIKNCEPTIPTDVPSKVIDFIMVRNAEKLKIIDSKTVDEKYASDHLPVIANFMTIR